MPDLASQFQTIFKKYLTLNHHLVADVTKVKAGQLAFGLQKGTYKHRANKAKIVADVRRQGWKLIVPKGFRDNPAFKRQPGEPSGAALKRFQDAVIAIRVRGIGFPSVGWLAACQKLGVATRANVRQNQILGECDVFIQGAVARVRMTNSTHGAKAIMDKYPVAAEAIQDMIADMQQYMDAKMRGQSGASVGGAR